LDSKGQKSDAVTLSAPMQINIDIQIYQRHVEKNRQRKPKRNQTAYLLKD